MHTRALRCVCVDVWPNVNYVYRTFRILNIYMDVDFDAIANGVDERVDV